MPNDHTILYADMVLKPETISAARKLGLTAEQILDRWTLGWKKRVLEMEEDGTLLPRLKEQAEKEALVLSDARVGGENNHLSQHEIMELYGISPEP